MTSFVLEQNLRVLCASVVNDFRQSGSSEPQRGKCFNVEAKWLAGEELRHQLRGDGRQQNAVTKGSGGDGVSGQGSGAPEGKAVGRAGTQARPGIVDAHVSDLGCDTCGGTMQALDSIG